MFPHLCLAENYTPVLHCTARWTEGWMNECWSRARDRNTSNSCECATHLVIFFFFLCGLMDVSIAWSSGNGSSSAEARYNHLHIFWANIVCCVTVGNLLSEFRRFRPLPSCRALPTFPSDADGRSSTSTTMEHSYRRSVNNSIIIIIIKTKRKK